MQDKGHNFASYSFGVVPLFNFKVEIMAPDRPKVGTAYAAPVL